MEEREKVLDSRQHWEQSESSSHHLKSVQKLSELFQHVVVNLKVRGHDSLRQVVYKQPSVLFSLLYVCE